MKKFTIKNIKLALVGAALIGFASSCDVTDLAPADLIPDQEAFATPARVQSAVLGVYEAAQRGFYSNSVQRGYPFGAANVEQGDMRGEDMYNDQLFYEITYVGSYNPNTANNNGMWISLYRMINRANIVIENLDIALANGVLTQAQRDGYRGEMLFLRALAHHELLIHFSRPYSDNPSAPGIPYRTFAINDVPKVPEGEAVPRGTVGEDYAQVLADLDEAENLMATGGAFRASKGAAIALKSRVKLHMEDWAGVLAEYAKIQGSYAVTANPVTPFRGGTSSDNIFSFVNSEAANAGVNGALASMYGNPNNGARGLVKISPLIWRADFWHAEDLRRTAMTTSSSVGVYTDKYQDNTTYTDPNVILRFAEVALNAAEANAQLGNLDAAVTLLNSVRDRALPDTVPSFTAAGLGGKDGILTAIYNERRIEFLAEGRRWADIHRLSGAGVMDGVPAKATSRSITNIDFYNTDREIPTDHSIEYSDYRFIWPIPLTEIQTNSSAPIAQNPGY
ncbi:RagB/SusD family nutrient uptake outer membrane protein [Algoriphagus sp. CAU 1675]|uniref:RagB/SusD family nutrient uptake outer membrane protein n=1 Tax=Algoriphagus sp. CAU 1675 TaxID=3032597 RepID=UPI0023DB3168|nr:RagB/SusD family nutrient uptake outer membrane protein [Algoriphagus sp. CAU 1675]MDF2156261.1 RagB/SusD family nutrient uptake outer membrane protein [Algoriphagus sp. CAU 1675]